jgi:hypothetical protein
MSFDAQSFLSAAITSSNDTKVTPVPVGEYLAIIDKIAARQWQSKDGTQTGVALDVFWSIEDANVKQYLGRDTVTCKQGIMLDLTPSGGVDESKGKNIGLGRLREAVGKNAPGERFTFDMLPGLMAKVSVAHRVTDTDVFAEVKAVARA